MSKKCAPSAVSASLGRTPAQGAAANHPGPRDRDPSTGKYKEAARLKVLVPQVLLSHERGHTPNVAPNAATVARYLRHVRTHTVTLTLSRQRKRSCLSGRVTCHYRKMTTHCRLRSHPHSFSETLMLSTNGVHLQRIHCCLASAINVVYTSMRCHFG